MSKKGKRIILSICISVSINLPFSVFVSLSSEAQRFPLIAQDVDTEMSYLLWKFKVPESTLYTRMIIIYLIYIV